MAAICCLTSASSATISDRTRASCTCACAAYATRTAMVTAMEAMRPWRRRRGHLAASIAGSDRIGPLWCATPPARRWDGVGAVRTGVCITNELCGAQSSPSRGRGMAGPTLHPHHLHSLIHHLTNTPTRSLPLHALTALGHALLLPPSPHSSRQRVRVSWEGCCGAGWSGLHQPRIHP